MKYELHIDNNGALSHITCDGVILTRADDFEKYAVLEAMKEHITWMNVHNSDPDILSAYQTPMFSEYMNKSRKIYIAVVGSRDWQNVKMVTDVIAQVVDEHTVIVSGGARGVDTIAVNHADKLGVKTVMLPAQWGKYGRNAGMIRNAEMLSAVSQVVAFWDGQSVGTKDMIDRAVKAKHVTSVVVYNTKGEQTILKNANNR